MQTETNRFKAALRAGQPQLGIWNTLCSNIVSDVLSTVGFDWAVIDMEHSPNGIDTVLTQLQGYAGSPTTTVVRPPWNDAVMTKRLLDMGAFSLLFPMVQNASEATEAVRSCRYPPHGIRGVSMAHRGNRYGAAGDYLERAADEICVLVQCETGAALDQVEEIAAVEGVDGVFFGPSDLAAALGCLGEPTSDAVVEAISQGGKKVLAAGKAPGILVQTPEAAKRWIDEGFTFVACGSDLGHLAGGARKSLAALKELVG